MLREHLCLSMHIEPPGTYIRHWISVLPQTWWSPTAGWMKASLKSTNVLFQRIYQPCDNTTEWEIYTKAYLCNQGGTLSLFLSRLACHIFGSDQQAWYLLFQHMYSLISMWMPTIYHMEGWATEWHLRSLTGQVIFQLLGQLEVDLLGSSHTSQCQHYYTLENPLPQGALGVVNFQSSLDISGE